MKSHPTTQPEFIDCQAELLARGDSVARKVARLKAALAVAIVCAITGWGVVVVIIALKARGI